MSRGTIIVTFGIFFLSPFSHKRLWRIKSFPIKDTVLQENLIREFSEHNSRAYTVARQVITFSRDFESLELKRVYIYIYIVIR